MGRKRRHGGGITLRAALGPDGAAALEMLLRFGTTTHLVGVSGRSVMVQRLPAGVPGGYFTGGELDGRPVTHTLVLSPGVLRLLPADERGEFEFVAGLAAEFWAAPQPPETLEVVRHGPHALAVQSVGRPDDPDRSSVTTVLTPAEVPDAHRWSPAERQRWGEFVAGVLTNSG